MFDNHLELVPFLVFLWLCYNSNTVWRAPFAAGEKISELTFFAISNFPGPLKKLVLSKKIQKSSGIQVIYIVFPFHFYIKQCMDFVF